MADIIYSDDKLFVNINDYITKKDYDKLKQRINYITTEYNIKKVIFNIKGIKNSYYIDDVDNAFKESIIEE